MKVDGRLLDLFNTYRLVDKVVVVLLLFPHARFVSSGLLYFDSGCCLLARSDSYFVFEVRTYLSLRFVLTLSQRFVLICHCDSYLISTAVRSYCLRFVLRAHAYFARVRCSCLPSQSYSLIARFVFIALPSPLFVPTLSDCPVHAYLILP